MRESTLLAHLSLTEDALRSERIRIADQLEFIRKLKLEGRKAPHTTVIPLYVCDHRDFNQPGKRSWERKCGLQQELVDRARYELRLRTPAFDRQIG
jgi:hypothetical protein